MAKDISKDIADEVAELLNGRSLLIIDDQRLSRHIVTRFFSGSGCADALQASDGSEGLALLCDPNHSIGAVVCDFNMPLVNGLQVLKAIRTGFSGIQNTIPVIMLTGHSFNRLVGLALALDVDAFIVKPVSKNTLLTRLRHVLRSQRTIKSPEECKEIDIEGALEEGEGHPPAATPEPATPKGRKVSPDEVAIPAVLARDINTPNGELLLAAGVTLTPRLLDRLLELREMGFPLDAIWIE